METKKIANTEMTYERVKPKRKVIQVSTTDKRTIALCDDGNIFWYDGHAWDRLPEIPQDENAI